MNKIKPRELHTDKLDIRIPRYEDQYYLWNIQKQEKVNIYYQSTPSRFKTRREYQEALQDWESQKKWYYLKIENLDKDSDMYSWTIFLKDTDKPIGQITVQPNDRYDDLNIRNIGWYIDPELQGRGLAFEAALEVLKFMFNEVNIEKIETEAVTVNEPSWRLMEKLGFERNSTIKASYKDMDDNDIYKYTYFLTKQMFLNRLLELEKDNQNKLK